MGRMLLQEVEQHPHAELSGGTARPGSALVGQTLEALRKSGDEHPFARVWGASRWQGAAEEEWMTGFGMAVDPQERT